MDLIGMDAAFAPDLGDSHLTLERFQSYLGFESRLMMPSLTMHWTKPPSLRKQVSMPLHDLPSFLGEFQGDPRTTVTTK